MPTGKNSPSELQQDAGPTHRPQADEPQPSASEDRVLDQTARLAREGERQLDNDPNEPKHRPT